MFNSDAYYVHPSVFYIQMHYSDEWGFIKFLC